MKVILIGVQEIKFEGGDKRIVEGVKLHLSMPDFNVYGGKAESKFIYQNVFDSFEVAVKDLVELIGTVVDIEFDNRGKAVGIAV